MKIRRGGSGVDKDGNVYKLSEDEVDVPDDYFEKAMAQWSNAPAPDYIIVSPEFWSALIEAGSNRRK